MGFDPNKAKVAVLMGGPSAEREVSLMSGNGVLQALLSKGIQAVAFDPAHTPLMALREQGISHAFIALHGRHGEDGTVQGALELMGIPYTGSGVMASAIAMDKHMTKRLWLAEGLSTPASIWLTPAQQTTQALADIPKQLGLPLIVKPPHEGSSIGVTKVSQAEQFQAETVGGHWHGSSHRHDPNHGNPMRGKRRRSMLEWLVLRRQAIRWGSGKSLHR